MQEDIIGITDSNNNLLCSYEYDSWGKIITIKDNNGNIITDESHIGVVNPFRYRSYYYDGETKLYYLNSRYYNSEWGRFINADKVVGVNDDIFSYNIYVYVGNNPINNYDENGHFFNKILDIVKKAVNNIIDKIANPSDSSKVKSKLTSNNKQLRKGEDLPYKGPANGHLKTPNGTKERWYDPSGNPIKDRHHTDHGNPKQHPCVPHDHDWIKKKDGKWGLSPWYDPNDIDTISEIVIAAGITYGAYEIIKWGLAAITSAPTGGGSLIVAGLMP